MSRRQGKARAKSVLPWQAIVVIVILLAGGVYFLIPDDRDLIQRYLDADQPEKAIEHLEDVPDMDPVDRAVARMKALRRIAIKNKRPELWSDAFNAGFSDYVELGGAEELLEKFRLVAPNLPHPDVTVERVMEASGTLSDERIEPVVRLLVETMLGQGEPELAARAYRNWVEESATGVSQIEELIRLRRLAGQEEEALADLKQLRASIEPSSEESLRLVMEEAALLQALDRVVDGFELLMNYTEENPAAVANDRFFGMIRSFSLAADRQQEVVSIMQERLRITPRDEDLFADYLDLNLALAAVDEAERALEEKRSAGTLTPRQARMLANIREWSGQPGKAFDEYRKLALEGDQEALQRLFELNEGLFRHYELAEILEEAPGGRSDELLLREARLLARIGEYQRSVEVYRQLLERADDPDAGWYAEMADVALTIHDFETALYGLRMGLRTNPTREQEIRWKKDIGWLLSLEGEYELAIAAYASVFLDYGEIDVLPSIVSLSSLVGDRELYRWTLEEIVRRYGNSDMDEEAADRMHRQKTFGAERRWQTAFDQYTRSLAQIYADEDRFVEAAEVIRLNSNVYSNGEIFEFLLNVLAEAKLFDEAAMALSEVNYSPDLLQSIDSIRTAVWILESAGRPGKALQLASSGFELFPNDDPMKLTVARLLAESGKTGEARSLFDSVDLSEAPPGMLSTGASVASALGQYAEAEALLTRYMKSKEELRGQDYTQIGDLRLAAGDPEAAKEAYREAVEILLHSGELESLSTADREELAYLYARLGNRTLAEPFAGSVLKDEPSNLRILLAMASLYLEEQDADRVLDYANQVLKSYPQNRDGLFFLAAGYQLSENPGKARKIFLRLKALYPDGARFPFELDLASSALQAGDWPQAIASYQSVLRDSQIAAPLRRDVRRTLDALYRQHLPMVRVGFSDIDAGTGTITDYGGYASTPLGQRFRLAVEGRYRETSIDATTTTQSASSGTSIYEATLRYDRPPGFGFRMTGRVFDDQAGFGVGVTRVNAGLGGQTLSFDAGLPATDSLNMRYLFGRENRLNLLIEQPVTQTLQLRSNLYSRWVYIEEEEYASGFGADWELSHYQRMGSIDVLLSYRGAYSHLDIRSDNLSLAEGLPYLPGFGPTPEVVEGLSSERIHREGFGLNLTRNFRDRWIFSANAGIDYYFYLREIAWNAGGGLIYRPLKSVDVTGDVSYSSADNRGDEDADNLQILLGISNRF